MPALGGGGLPDENDFVEEHVQERLRLYVELIEKWKQVTNIVSEKSFRAVWNRHIIDSLYLQKERPEARSWLDIGSGAGFPGAVIAIVLAESPDAQIHCVEVDRRKCAFLREVASRLQLPMKVHNTFAESELMLEAPDVEVVTARAFSSAEKFLEIAQTYMKRGAIAVLPRGRSARDEVARLDQAMYSVRIRPNPASADGLFVHIECRRPHIS